MNWGSYSPAAVTVSFCLSGGLLTAEEEENGRKTQRQQHLPAGVAVIEAAVLEQPAVAAAVAADRPPGRPAGAAVAVAVARRLPSELSYSLVSHKKSNEIERTHNDSWPN